MIEYLKIGLPEVKHHIIYNLGTIIRRIPALTAILEDIDFAIYDDDPNVRSALIQTISELFPLGNLPEEVLSTYLQNGINDSDYIVRLVTIQQINNLVETTPYLLKQLPVYLEKSLKDSNSDVFEEAYSIFQKNYVYLQNNFTKWVKETGLDVNKI
jgi:HEAT repeat protein